MTSQSLRKAPIRAEEWVEWFLRGWQQAVQADGTKGRPLSGVQLSVIFDNSQLSINDRLEHRGESPEWTNVMGMLLAEIAHDNGFRQEWEQEGKVDFSWYPMDAGRVIPSVLIEHESYPGTQVGRSRKIPVAQERPQKLSRKIRQADEHPLGILITYPWEHGTADGERWDVERIRKRVQFSLEDEDCPDERFLLVVENVLRVDSPEPHWSFWVWTGGALRSITRQQL